MSNGQHGSDLIADNENLEQIPLEGEIRPKGKRSLAGRMLNTLKNVESITAIDEAPPKGD